MARDYNPLSYIPRSEVVRQHLSETELLARRLRILLRVAEQLEQAKPANSKAENHREVSHA